MGSGELFSGGLVNDSDLGGLLLLFRFLTEIVEGAEVVSGSGY